jgi:serine/threonine protein kinase
MAEESLPLSAELRIDAVCRSFEAAWQAAAAGGTRPRIEEYLGATAPPEREALLAELLKVELHYRRGERPTADEYRRRFPQHERLITHLFEQLAAAPGPQREGGGRETVRVAAGQETGTDPNRTEAEALPGTGAGEAGGAAGLPAVPGYEVLEVLGRGAMGVVYKARHVKLNRLVALKMILSGAHAGEPELARFRSEAEAVARLQHPNVVQIHEIGEHAGLPYFSLEFVDGGSLQQHLAGTPQQPGAAAQLLETLARAVHAAHEKGIVHRDLKPANVLLTRDGVPKVSDFGLAKQLDADSGRTQSGAILGTPSYMAPEQAAGRTKEVGPPADVWALGAILYEALTGGPPFRGATVRDTLEQVCTREPVPPRQWQPKVPRDLETICLKCLHKEPHRRYASALALAEDLERFQERKPIVARPVGRLERAGKWARRNPAVAAFLTVLVVGTVVSASLAVYAVQKAELAHSSETAAVNANTELGKANDELKNANASLIKKDDQLLTALARSLLRPLAVQAGPLGEEGVQWPLPLTDPEIKALRELVDNPDERLGPRFVEEALRSPVTTRQLRARAALAMHAAVGLSPDKQEQVEKLLCERLQDSNLDAEQKTDLALVALDLGELTPTAAIRAVQVFIQAMAKTDDPIVLNECARGMSGVASRVGPQGATQAANALAQAITKTKDPQKLLSMAHGLSALATRMESHEGSRICAETAGYLTHALTKADSEGIQSFLAHGITEAATGLEPKEATQVADILKRAMLTDVTGARDSLAQGLSAVAARMEPREAAATLTQAMQFMSNQHDLQAVLALAQGLSAVVARMEPKEAAVVCARAADILMQAMAKTDRPDDWSALAGVLSAVAARMEPKEGVATFTKATAEPFASAKGLSAVAVRMEPEDAARAADFLTQAIMSKLYHDSALGPLAEGLSAVARHMDPKPATRVADTLLQAMVKSNEPSLTNPVHPVLAHGLSAVAARMEPKEAATTLTRAMISQNDPDTLDWLAQGLSTVAAHIGPQEAARAADVLTQAIAKSSSPGAMERLVEGLAVVAARMGPQESAREADSLTQAMAKTTDPKSLRWLAQGLSAVSVRMEPKEASRVCARAADLLTQARAQTNDPQNLHELAQGLSAVSARMEPKEAAIVCARAAHSLAKVMTETDDLRNLSALARGLSAVAARMEAKEAGAVCAHAADILMQAMARLALPDPYKLNLAEGLSALSIRMEPKQAAAILTQAMAKTVRPALPPLARGLSAVAVCMEPEDAAWAIDSLTQAMAKNNALGDPGPWAQGLSALLARADRPELSGRATAVMAAVGFLNERCESLVLPAILAPALEPLPCRFSTPELVELLKQPTCVGLARRAILDQLEHRYQRKFADQWDFVHFAQEQNLGLDFTSPPKRFGTPAVDENK